MADFGRNFMMSIKGGSLNTERCQIHLNFCTSSKARTASQSSMAKLLEQSKETNSKDHDPMTESPYTADTDSECL